MLRGLVVFAIIIPGVALALTSRFRALQLYLWFAFFRPQEWLWFPIQDLRLSMVLGLILVVPALGTGVFPNLTHPVSIGFLLFLLSGLVAQLNAVDQAIGWRYLDIHGSFTIVCLLAITIIRTPRQLMLVVAMAAGCYGFFAAKAGLASLFAGGIQYGEGFAGAFVDNNSYAVGAVMTIPFLVALAQNIDLTFGWVPKVVRVAAQLALYISVPSCLYLVVSTFSRGGFLALVAAALAYLAFHQRRLRILIVFALLGGLLYFVPLPQGYVDRIATISRLQEDVEEPRDDVTEGRFYFWNIGLNMVKEHPLGIGVRNFGARYAEYDTLGAFGRRRDVHSSHMQVLVESGVFGAAAWIFLITYVFVMSSRIRRRARSPGLPASDARLLETLPVAIVVSMAGFLVGGATMSMALNELTWLTFVLIASLDLLSRQMCAEAAKNVGAVKAPEAGTVSRAGGSLGQGRQDRLQSAFPGGPATGGRAAVVRESHADGRVDQRADDRGLTPKAH